MGDYIMNINELFQKIKNIDKLTSNMSEKLVVSIHNVDNYIRNVFFKKYERQDIPALVTNYNDQLNDIARTYISDVISHTGDYDLRNMVLGSDILDKDLNALFEDSNHTIGEALALEVLRDNLPDVFADSSANEQIAKEITDYASTEAFINGMAVYCDIAEQHLQPLRLLWLLTKHLSYIQSERLKSAWNATEYSKIISSIYHFPWMDGPKGQLASGMEIFNTLQNDIKENCMIESEIKREQRKDVIDITPSGAPICKNYIVITYAYGAEVQKWIETTSRYYSGKKSSLKTRTKKVEDNSGGCILCGTKLILADGSLADETQLKEKDMLLSEKLMPSEYSGEIIFNNHVLFLYSINNDEPFMSLDHMILTIDGYKCPMPQQALKINNKIKVSKLKIGDIVIKHIQQPDGSIKEEMVKVEKINIAENNKLCYDIHISDGYKSYTTENGYVCYVNYPEITMKNINDSLSRSKNVFANRDFRRFVKNNRKDLQNAFGKETINYLTDMLENENIANGVVPLKSFRPDDNALMSIDSIGMKIYALSGDSVCSKIHIVNNHIFFDDSEDTPVKLYINDGNYYWKRVVENGEKEIGILRMYEHGLYGKGIIKRGKNIFSFLSTSTNKYTMKYQPHENGEVIDFGTFEMGYEAKDGVLYPVGRWEMKYINENGEQVMDEAASSYDTGKSISYFIDSEHILASRIQFKSAAMLQFIPLQNSEVKMCQFSFDTSFESVKGCGYNNIEAEEENNIGTIFGSLEENIANKKKAMKEKAAFYSMNNKMTACNYPDSDEICFLNSQDELNVHDLFNLSQPEDVSAIHSASLDKLIKMSAHVAYNSNDDVSKYIGITKPTVGTEANDLTTDEANLAEQYSDFFINEFALSYISYSYSKTPGDDFKKYRDLINNAPDSENKLKFYLQGTDQNCMSSQKGYKYSTNSIYPHLYSRNVPGLNKYINDNGAKWAKELYEYCISPNVLNGLITSNLVDPDNTRINHLCTILDILDQSPHIDISNTTHDEKNNNEENKLYSYGAALHKFVEDGILFYAFENVLFPDGKENASVDYISKVVEEFFKVYFDNLNKKTFTDWTEEMYAEAKKEIEDYAQSLNYKDASEMIQNISSISADIAETLFSLSEINAGDVITCVSKLYKKFPCLPKLFTTVIYSCGLITVFSGFSRWNDLSDFEKGTIISNTVLIAVSAIKDVTVYAACKNLSKSIGNLMREEDVIINGIESEKDVFNVLYGSTKVENSINEMGKITAELISEFGEAEEAAESITKFAKVSRIAGKAMNIAMMAVALAVEIYETVLAFQSGESPLVETLQIMETISIGIGLLAEVGSLFLTSGVFAAIPVVGTIASIVGIVIAVILIFIPKKKPEDPLETFINNRCIPFINKLQSPSKEWLDEKSKVDKHINENQQAVLAL